MTQQFKTNGSFEVRRMSSGSFAIITVYFLFALIFLSVYIFYYNSLFTLFSCLFVAALGIYNTAKKHKNDSVFIEVDATGIWVYSKEITTWNNYRGSYISIKKDPDDGNYNSKKIMNDQNRILQRVINIEHYKNGQSGYFIHQLFFNGSEDKVENEVIDAIEFYYNHKKAGNNRFRI
jgi:hypothetical protein